MLGGGLLWWCLSVVDGRMVGSGFIFIIIVKSRGINFWKEFSPPPLCSPMIMFRAVGSYENLEGQALIKVALEGT